MATKRAKQGKPVKLNTTSSTSCAADILSAFALDNLDGDDYSLALDLIGAFRAYNVSSLGELSARLDPSEFLGDRDRFLRRRQFLALFKKLDLRRSEEHQSDAAYRSWYAAERQCKRANFRFKHIRHNWPVLQRARPAIASILDMASSKLQRMLGPCDLAAVLNEARSGPGVTQGLLSASDASIYSKMFETDHTVSPGCVDLVSPLVGGTLWASALKSSSLPVQVVEHSRHTLVPKDWRTKRSIAIEPSMNTWLQLGVHSCLSRRLDRTGNGIRDQRRNGLAASRSDNATLDLSSASDTISYHLVEFLLRGRFPMATDQQTLDGCAWFELLTKLRCAYMEVDGVIHRLEKFSSMGNGYTFALETMIFLSLARATAEYCGDETNPMAYGDDIIISQNSSLLLSEVLLFCGFSVNQNKSYYVGPFRESCGFDWYEGVYCTPLYLRSVETPSLYQLYNDAGLDDQLCWVRVKRVILAELTKRKSVVRVTGNVPPNSGIQSPAYDVSRRWHPGYHTYVQRILVFRPDTRVIHANRCRLNLQLLAANLLGQEYMHINTVKYGLARRRRGSYSLQSVPICGSYIGPRERKLLGMRG